MSFSALDQKIDSFDSKINVNVPLALCENMSLDNLFTAIPILIPDTEESFYRYKMMKNGSSETGRDANDLA